VWEGLERHLAGARAVLLAPDGELAGLPFAALPGRKPGSFLLEDYSFGYLTSGRQLLEPADLTKGKAGGLLTLGGADFGRAGAAGRLGQPRDWQSLPGTEAEARGVEDLFAARFPGEPRRSLTGAKADRAGLLGSLGGGRRWRVLHLGTHGFFEEVRALRNPRMLRPLAFGPAALGGLAGRVGALAALRLADSPDLLDREGFDPTGRGFRVYQRNPLLACSLVLAGVNQKGEEGYLTAEEIAGLDLRGCELATLSACETGLGKLAGWQGVQGLQQGFHEAGVRNVLCSLWSVSDAATSVLMEEFYRQLWRQGATPAEALRQAQLAVLKDPGRVEKRRLELGAILAKRGVPAKDLERRGLGRVAPEGPAATAGAPSHSPVAWWAAWVLSGPGR
jgi:CHAT domain-containing protein